eukprot:SAG11_NODE_12607_length_694_cov_3.149580_1_plen_89_part_10
MGKLAGWRSALEEAETDARRAWGWAEEATLVEKKLEREVDEKMEDVWARVGCARAAAGTRAPRRTAEAGEERHRGRETRVVLPLGGARR